MSISSVSKSSSRFPAPAGDAAGATTLTADALIVGGGFVGLALACGLAGSASSIALTSRRLLSAIGVWPKLADEAAPMLDIRVSEGASRLFLHYDHREVGNEPFGHMLENRVLRRALLQRLRELPAATLFAPARLVSLDRGADHVSAVLAGGENVEAPLAVAADGRDSRVREDAGIRITRWSYRQTAIVTTVEHERPHGFVANEHFLPAGPFAILPLLPETRSSIVWTERAAVAPSTTTASSGSCAAGSATFWVMSDRSVRASPIRCRCNTRRPAPRRASRCWATRCTPCTRSPDRG